MEKLKVVLVGCGDRACVYAEEGVHKLEQMEIVAAVDPDEVRLQYVREHFGVAEAMCFRDQNQLLARGKIADCVINGTMDKLHLQTAVPFLEQGYDMLLEKPLVNNKKDLLLLYDTAKAHGCKLMTCHVLRYTPFYRKIKELILGGEIGEIVNICTDERVGAFHSSVSYIRGKWKSEKECGSSLLLAKCCHDIDLLCWLNAAARPAQVFSYGGRDFFIPEKAPNGAGTRCLVDCPEDVRKQCIYDVQSMYLDNCLLPWYPWQCTGKDYHDVTMEEKIASLKTYNPHGVCAYKAGGDIADHQNVALHFKNGSTAVHSLTLGCMKAGRSIFISGTRGEIEGKVEDGFFCLRKYDRKTSTYTEQRFDFKDRKGETGGHFGGDRGLVADFCGIMLGSKPSVSYTSIENSITGHLLVYAADESMKSGSPVDL